MSGKRSTRMARLTVEEQRRAAVLGELDRGEMTSARAAEVLGLRRGHLRRLLAKYREKGPGALAHGNRGRKPANALDPTVTAKVAELARTKYAGLRAKHLAEKLGEEGIKISLSSVRRILIAFGVESRAGRDARSNSAR